MILAFFVLGPCFQRGTKRVFRPFLSRSLVFEGDLLSFPHISVQVSAFQGGPALISGFFLPGPIRKKGQAVGGGEEGPP